MKKYVFLILGVIGMLTGTATAWAEDAVYFADPNLKAAVETALGKANPTPTDMLRLTYLDVMGKGIVDLMGLEYATNLQSIYAPANQIADIQPLSGLTNLQWLELQSNRIIDVSPLVGLKNLSTLYLNGNQISDISPLAGLTNMTGLGLGGNQISDISPLSDLTNLKGLLLNDNQITDIEPLSGLTALQALYLSSNPITDIGPLSGLTDLRMINLGGTRIIDIQSLSGLTKLQELYLNSNNMIQDIQALSNLTDMEFLEISYNQITDIGPLSGMTKLQTLKCKNNQIGDIESLSGLVKLEELWLAENNITDISPLTNLTRLTKLWLADNRIVNISPLAGLTKLTELRLHINQLSDISPLAGMTSLNLLELWANPLNREAYDLYLPLIRANNPDITLYYDPCLTCYRLMISSTRGGSVTTPGGGCFVYDSGRIVELVAMPETNFSFARWTGTAVDAGKVADPQSARTTVNVDGDYTLKAEFLSVLDEIHVDDNAPLDPDPNTPLVSDPNEDGTPEHPFDSIQKAIDAARQGVLILVHEGIYHENLNPLGKAITIQGLWLVDANSVDLPVIQGTDSGPVVSFTHGEDPNCRLMGLFLTSDPGVRTLAVNCIDSSPTISHCIIAGNRSPDPGPGGVLEFENSSAVMANCTITGNVSYLPVLTCRNSPDLTLINSILWGNSAQWYIRALSGGLPKVSYCNVQEIMVGPGNLSQDPLFVDNGRWDDNGTPNNVFDDLWIMDDYHLKSSGGRFPPVDGQWQIDPVHSPCIDAGDPNAPVGGEVEPNGSRINLGAFGGTWQASLSGQ